MPAKSFIVSVEPNVLIWARDRMRIDDVVKKIKNITAKTIENWEKGEEKPTFAHIERLASIYKRPITAFLLPTPPEEPPFPTDFRTRPSEDKKTLNPKTYDEEVPVIVLRRSEQPSAKIFTLFHEFAHLLLKEGGICDLEETEASQSIERFSNHFAGAFLVPKNELLNHPVVKANEELKEWPDNILKGVARDFKVSKEVILRRLLILGKTTKAYYRSKHKEWKSKYKEPFGKGKKDVKICIRERGKKYISMVFNAYERNKIDNMSVADYLGIKLDKISKLKEAI